MPDLTIKPNWAALRPDSVEDAVRVLGTANQVSLGPLQAGDINAMLMGNPVGKLVGQAGMRYAAMAGNQAKGILTWMQDGAPQSFVFQMNPEALDDQVSPQWAETTVPGQNRPQYHFVNGGARKLSFTLHFFYADRRREAIAEMLEQLRQLGQRQEETPGTTALNGPPVLYFYFGRYYQGFRCVLTGLTVRAFDLFDPALLLPMRATADVEFTEVRDTYGGDAVVPVRGQTIGLTAAITRAL